MLRLIRRLPGWGEFAIVFAVAFGLFVGSVVVSVIHDLLSGVTVASHYYESMPRALGRWLYYLVGYELLVFLLLGPFLYLRGWTLSRLGAGRPRVRDVFIGLGLVVVTEVLWIGTMSVAYWLQPERWTHAALTAGAAAPVQSHANLAVVLLASVVNPIYEEIFLCGYVITALRLRHGRWLALGVSVTTRTLYHLNQGVFGAFGVATIGLLFGWWYLRKGRIWPLVIAHGLLDFAAISYFLYAWNQ